MSAPRRIQRKRTKGWRMPEGAIYVGRPTRWGNPFVLGRVGDAARWTGWTVCTADRWWSDHATQEEARAEAVRLFALHTGPMGSYEYDEETLARLATDLRGRDLVCWCPLIDANDQPVPCHADVLLEIANGGAPC